MQWRYHEPCGIAELNEMLNTMNMASVLQGDNPPILFNSGIYI